MQFVGDPVRAGSVDPFGPRIVIEVDEAQRRLPSGFRLLDPGIHPPVHSHAEVLGVNDLVLQGDAFLVVVQPPVYGDATFPVLVASEVVAVDGPLHHLQAHRAGRQ